MRFIFPRRGLFSMFLILFKRRDMGLDEFQVPFIWISSKKYGNRCFLLSLKFCEVYVTGRLLKLCHIGIESIRGSNCPFCSWDEEDLGQT
ncbi:hypothetical protein QQP08_019787 [Theobroma cacao]|nr:hypothetical protein QQP08_019787 [Theobroma cacao]